ncbi:hypothetical protein ABT234_11275 [Streptomyces sp. NPDC001586]|uniref:hypothetical protein n=1 Tax=Streptomyces sp. NPDC001586 TaxID=3154387 RepID=UPI003332C250
MTGTRIRRLAPLLIATLLAAGGASLTTVAHASPTTAPAVTTDDSPTPGKSIKRIGRAKPQSIKRIGRADASDDLQKADSRRDFARRCFPSTSTSPYSVVGGPGGAPNPCTAAN